MKLPKPSYNLCLDQVTIYLHLAQKSTNDQDRDRYLVAVARWARKAREALETK
jgi:hypothetical protein